MTSMKSVDPLFEGKTPELRATIDHLVNKLQQFGEIRVAPKQTSIHLEKNSGFAGVHPRKTYFNLEFRTDYKIDDPLITRVQQLSARRFEHTVKLEHESDVDEQLHSGLLPSLAFFHHVHEQRRLMQAFIQGSGAERLMRDFQAQVSQIVAENLRSLTGDEATFSVPLSVAANFVVSTLLMLIQWWFEEGMRRPPEEIDAMFQKLVMPSIHALIVSKP